MEAELIWYIIEYTAAFLGVLGAILVAFKKRFGYLCWIVNAALWTVFGIACTNYGIAGQFAVFFVISIIGYWYWGKEE